MDILVMQCKNCNFIVGDTTFLLAADEKNHSIALYKKPERIMVDPNHKIRYGSDINSIGYECTWLNLWCVKCHQIIGRQYKGVTPEQGHVQLAYTMDVNSLLLYQIGKEVDKNSIGPANAVNKTIPSIMQEIDRLQKVFVYCYQAIENIYQEIDKIKEIAGQI